MSLNSISQEDLERIEAEIYAELIANYKIQENEKLNLIGKQPYGKPELPEENCGSGKHSN